MVPPGRLPAGLVVEAAEQALGLQRVVVDFERTSGADGSWRAARAAAEVGVEILKPERPFRGQLIFEADAGRPSGTLARTLREAADQAVLQRRRHLRGGNATFDVRQPLAERIAEAAGDGADPIHVWRPATDLRNERAREPAVEVCRRQRTFEAEHEISRLEVVAEAVVHRRRRWADRGERVRRVEIVPNARRLRTAWTIAAQIEAGPRRTLRLRRC